MRIHATILTLCLTIVSCEKETSIEAGNRRPALGNDCRPMQVVGVDSATGRGTISFLTRFDATGRANAVEVYDSLSSRLMVDEPLVRTGDTLRLPSDAYLLLDTSGRVRRFVARQVVNNAPQTIRYDYSYDAGGYLVRKELFSSAIPLPIPLVQFKYTWTGQNLVQVDGTFVIPGMTQKVLSATLEYDLTQSARNFLPILPDAVELALPVMAVDMGKRSRNLVSRISLTTYGSGGMPDSTLTARYGDYVFTTDGYLVEWKVSGDPIPALPFPPGRNRIRYFCR